MLITILLVFLIILLIAAIPSWPYNRDWGYGPSGILAIILFIIFLMWFFEVGPRREDRTVTEPAGRDRIFESRTIERRSDTTTNQGTRSNNNTNTNTNTTRSTTTQQQNQ